MAMEPNINSRQGGSIRWRFVITTFVVVSLALPAIFYTQSQVRQASQDSSLLVQEHRDLGWVMNSLKDSLQVTESAIYQYPVLLDDPAYRKVLVRIAETKSQSKRITEHYVVKRYQQFGDFAANLDYVLNRLDEETNFLLKVLSNVETRYPAAPILLHELLPTNLKFIQAVEVSIVEASERPESTDQQKVMRLLEDLRYTWAQQISSVRIFIANRSGVFGQPVASMKKNKTNRELYAQRVEELLSQLKEYDNVGKLGFQQSLSINSLFDLKLQYDRSFAKAEKIYFSRDWRGDLPILRDDIRPILDQAWGIIELMQEELDELAQKNVMKTLGTADTLSNVIWGFAGFM